MLTAIIRHFCRENSYSADGDGIVMGTSQVKIIRNDVVFHWALHQVHSKRLHNDTKVPTLLQSPYFKGSALRRKYGIGMLTSSEHVPVGFISYWFPLKTFPLCSVLFAVRFCIWLCCEFLRCISVFGCVVNFCSGFLYLVVFSVFGVF